MASPIDGSALSGVGSAQTQSVALTTTQADDVIIVFVEANSLEGGVLTPSDISVSDAAGLTWTQRASMAGTSGSAQVVFVEFWALAPAALSADTITATSSAYVSLLVVAAFGVSGAATPSSPFDPSGSLPATAASGSPAVSTSDASSVIFGAFRLSPESPGDMPSPWTTIEEGSWLCAGYWVPGAAQTNLSIPLPAGSTDNGAIGDAIVAAAGGTATSGAARSQGYSAGQARLVIPPVPVGLGGPPRGPRPVMWVRSIFRRRWRRYGLSYASVAITPPGTGTPARGAGAGHGGLGIGGAAHAAAAARSASSGRVGAAVSALIGLGGPPRGPRAILPVRGIYRGRWRRYRLSYSSLAAGSGSVLSSAKSRGAAFAALQMPGALAGGARGEASSAAGAAFAANGVLASVSRGAARGIAGLLGAVAGRGRAGSAGIARIAGTTGGLLASALRGGGMAVARLAGVSRASGIARAVAAESGRARLAGGVPAVARGAGTTGARLILHGLASVAASGARGASVGRLAGRAGEIARVAVRATGAVVGRLVMVGGGALEGRAAGGLHGAAGVVGNAEAWARTAGAAGGRVAGASGFAITGALSAAGGMAGRAAWNAAGALTARTAGQGSARAAVAGALAGWLRAIAAALGAMEGGEPPLAFDSRFWMLPPVTGLVMTALPSGHNKGPYA